MNSFFDEEIIDALFEPLLLYRELLIKDKEVMKELIKDENYEGEEDWIFWMLLFMIKMLKQKGGVKYLYNKLKKNNINEKKINSFIYTFLKLEHKTKNGLFSWFEINELNIPFEKVKKTTTKYIL